MLKMLKKHIKKSCVCAAVIAGVLSTATVAQAEPIQEQLYAEQEVVCIVDDIKAKQEEEAAKIRAQRRQEMDAVKEAAAEQQRLAKRQELVDFAVQFVGNPYVYGGTSLTNGADCSGFTQAVFANFGYELPRVAADQAYAGTQKSIEEMEIGDLVFYGSSIYHVGIYMGDGQIVHASTSATGIKISNYDYEQPSMIASYMA